MPSFKSQGANIRLFAEIQAAAENILAALVFAREALSSETKTILPFKYVNQPNTRYAAILPKSKINTRCQISE